MKTKNFIISFLMFCVLILASLLLEPEEPKNIELENGQVAGSIEEKILYRVNRVVDGDTIVVEGEQRVRMIGIDTPETVHPSKPVECFGQEASNKLKDLIEDKQVQLFSDSTQDDLDRYGRLLRYVYLDDIDINLEMIKQGYAFEYTYRVPYEKQEEYKQAEINARESKLGLWDSTNCNY